MADFRPTRPRFRAINSNTLVLAAGAITVVAFDTVVYDDVGGYNGAGTYTVDRDGLYELCCGLRFNAVASAGLAQGAWSINGVAIAFRPLISTNSICGLFWSEKALLAAGDQVQLVAAGHATLPRSLQAGLSFGEVTRIGPKAWT